nr:MAK10-like protein [Tanacetum cinerariifolium]
MIKPSQPIPRVNDNNPPSLAYTTTTISNPFSSTTLRDKNPIRTLGDYSKPSYEGYRNTIELPIGNNMVPLRPDTIRDFAKPVKAIGLPQDVSSTSDRHLIEFETQVQRLMEAHLAPTQPTQVNNITTSCEICSGPHDTQYCMEDPGQAFVDYASSRTDEAGGLYEFMTSQDARLSKFKADFKRQQGVMTNKIDTVLKAITDQIVGTLPSDTVKNLKLSATPGRGFLATANAVIDCRIAKIAVGEGITRSVFGVKGVDLGEDEAPYWTTLGKGESYKSQPSSDGVGTQTPYYARKDFLNYHLPREWEVSRDAKLNPFKDTLVFRRMDKRPKNGDGAWHAKIRLIDPDGEEFTKTL